MSKTSALNDVVMPTKVDMSRLKELQEELKVLAQKFPVRKPDLNQLYYIVTQNYQTGGFACQAYTCTPGYQPKLAFIDKVRAEAFANELNEYMHELSPDQ